MYLKKLRMRTEKKVQRCLFEGTVPVTRCCTLKVQFLHIFSKSEGSHEECLSRTCKDKVGVKCLRSHRKIEWMDGDVRIPLFELCLKDILVNV